MEFKLTVKQKLSEAEFSPESPVENAGEGGVFSAQAITFARTQANSFIREWTQSDGLTMRSQKDWAKNIRTKNFEKRVMVQKGTNLQTYIFVLEQQ